MSRTDYHMKLTERKTAKGILYYLQTTVTIDGQRKQQKFPMGDNKKIATTKANRFLATLGESGLHAALEELNGGNPLKKKDSPNIEQMDKLYRQFLSQSAKQIRTKTVYDNLKALERVMRACNAETISEINPKTLRSKMLPAKPTDAQLRGFSATIMHAKSIFKESAMNYYKSEGLNVDNPFETLELTAPQIKAYVPLSREIIDKVKKDSVTLPACEQIILLLSLEFGMRRIEIEHCKTSWFTDDGGKVFLSIQDTEDFKGKTNDGRLFPVSRQVYQKILSLRETLNPKNDFVAYVDGDAATQRLDRRFKSLTSYLKKCGVTGTRPIQRMRAEAGSRIASETSIFEAQRVLGHSSPVVTSKHYANLLDLKTVGEGSPEESPEEHAAKLLGISVEQLRAKLRNSL